MRATILWIGAFVAACSSANTDGNGAAGGDLCAVAQRTCPDVFTAQRAVIPECTPLIACQMQCLLDEGCALDATFWACDARCRSSSWDAGTPDTSIPCHSDVDCPSWARSCSAGRCVAGGVADSGTPTPVVDTGSGGGGDTSTGGGGAGCDTVYDDYSCTCIAGTYDDGKGCSPHTLAAPAGCCSTSSKCACDAVTCTSSGSGCICILGGYGPTDTSCSGALCCAFEATSDAPGNCQCYDKPGTGGCGALGGTTVSSCSASNTPCYDSDERSVSSCE